MWEFPLLSHISLMSARQTKAGKQARVVRNYDTAADARNRVSLRGARTKYFHVKALSNGCYLLEPRILVAPEAVSSRALKKLERAVAASKKEKISAAVDLSRFEGA